MSKITKAAKAVKKVDTGNIIRAIVRSGQAAPGPPLGPILGQLAPKAGAMNDLDICPLSVDRRFGAPWPGRRAVRLCLLALEPAVCGANCK
ncbi:unnamed protein product [Menidia menidia]|uniref:(Atlantic silverside) hypothetical protein n=1 Tax=Menidia menidia TaxID=238744 RepID=A0A8S4BSE0_9TELE|nr:unnamed protein product [Menidia menidia]